MVIMTIVSSCPAEEEQEIVVGRSAAGELKIENEFTLPVELPVSIFPGIPGYATGELALHSTILDDPTNDFFQLSIAADFQLILLARDPGMEIWNGFGFMATNEAISIGPSPFDNHPIWDLANGTPGHSYSLTLKLRDLNGVYPDSAPFVLSFTPLQVRYRIEISRADATHATLSWPTNAFGWDLQAAASVTATNWNTVTNTPGLAGTNVSLPISLSGPQQFFRLRRP